jgi:hypothetical protein
MNPSTSISTAVNADPVPDVLTEKQRFWFTHAKRCLESGLSIAAYARQQQLSDKSLYQWVKRFRERQRGVEPIRSESVTFQRVQLAQSVPSPTFSQPVLWLRLPSGFECEWRYLNTVECVEVLGLLSRLSV